MLIRKKFTEIFEENGDSLKLLVTLNLRGTIIPSNTTFKESDGLQGVDFHSFRYLDVAVDVSEDGTHTITGFYSNKR